METNKSYFQKLSLQMEDMLKQYKNQYPKNLGDILRNALPYILLALGVIVLPMFSFGRLFSSGDLATGLGLHGSSVLLIALGVIMIFKFKGDKATDPTLSQRINATKNQMSQLAEYPDVKKYLDGYNTQIAQTAQSKQSAKNKFYMIIAATVLLGMVYWFMSMKETGIFSGFNFSISKLKDMKYDPNKNTTITVNFGLSGATEIIGIGKTEPLMTLLPLKTDINGGGKVETAKIDVFFMSGILVIKELNISGASDDDRFRLIVTDLNGDPIARSPRFVFKPSQTTPIESVNFCYEKDISMDIKSTQSYFSIIQVCRFLHTDQKNLRFLVEKI
ncbi:MAG: hypothetical protein K6F33_01010 [Bacteroidales bacterium]|nr:hypothetical protein [Bacteroidales bacterium]